MRSFLLAVMLSLLGCAPSAVSEPADASLVVADLDAGADAGTDGGADAGSEGLGDAGTPQTWAADIQPLLASRCAHCHLTGRQELPFADRYELLQMPSGLCAGERVADCVKRALEAQAVEGTGCRTYVVTPFHREAWACLTPSEVEQVVSWIDGGMRER